MNKSVFYSMLLNKTDAHITRDRTHSYRGQSFSTRIARMCEILIVFTTRLNAEEYLVVDIHISIY